MDRRKFVQLVGLASGASILSSCGLERETEKLIPYLIPPDDGVIPGKPVFYRTTCTECPAGCGVTARVIDRKAAKLEGIESHPVNDGALCMRGQASISRLQHPARLRRPLVKDAGGTLREASNCWCPVVRTTAPTVISSMVSVWSQSMAPDGQARTHESHSEQTAQSRQRAASAAASSAV